MPDLIGHLPFPVSVMPGADRASPSCPAGAVLTLREDSGRALIGWRDFDGELLLIRSFGP